MDENNQYGNAMTKPLPAGCIKKSEKVPGVREFQLILKGISHENKTEYLFIVDIEFDFHRAGAKELLFNEVYLPIFGKKSFTRL